MLTTPHFHAPNEPEFIRSPAVMYLSILGSGSPGTDEFYRKKALIGDIARQVNNNREEPVIEIQYWYPAGSTPVEIADFYSINPVPSLLYRVLAVVPDGTQRRRRHRAEHHCRAGRRAGHAPRPIREGVLHARPAGLLR
jgi:hypothetical protein